MSTGEWLPDHEVKKIRIEPAQLRKLAAISLDSRLDEIASVLSETDRLWLAEAMRAERQTWQEAAASLDDIELTHLIRALAIAETRIDDCSVGPKSPVIYVHGVLKARGKPLCKADLIWLKQNSSNRFLPNGPII